ncbi:hypothetical protein FB45DRAFT_1017267 [Roridomyces roridus]|uniref:DUF6533 domain-containing protein n=1 Tax=Roridomyces roridus TaxID=1738132 RepID=A0AAD7CI62_9AGAR|nr:hypothetical protein FB45DRAFT_1017267 [Roridomyces roridus]
MATISPAAAAAQEAALLQLITDSQTTNYLAGLTLLIIEHISTFKEEVEYVWKSRLSLWSVLYVWTRYATLIAFAIDLSYFIDTVPKRLLLPRCAFMSKPAVLGLNANLRKEVPRLFTFYALAPFLMSVLMFAMTAYKCGQHIRLKSSTAPMPVFTLFLRDGLFFFLAMMLVTTACMIVWHSARPTLAQMPAIPAVAIPAVLAGRILLNIKNLAYHDSNTTPTIELTTLSQQHSSLPSIRANRVPWYLQTGEVKDVGNWEEM